MKTVAEEKRWTFIDFVLLGMIFLGLPILTNTLKSSTPSSPSQSDYKSVVLSNPEDPYYPLATEIATAEDFRLVHELSDAIACHPVFLVWVASPDFLSETAMIEFGLAIKEQSSAISSGIISASSLEEARSLWERRSQVRRERFFAINAPNPSAHIYEGRIIESGQEEVTILTKDRFIDTLQIADYLTFTGHGASKYLRLDENTKITSEDVPALNAIVIGTGSCQTFRLWNEDSIARRFVDQGAAAYSGFSFSPNEGYLIGEFDGLPFRYTWPDFPIGHVIQVQNRGTLQGFAHFPYQHLLGDPQTALQTEAPYELIDDYQEDKQRVLTFQELPPGIIPIRIPDGAAYHYVEAMGITAAADQDPFYNSRLQMVNIQNDKFILLMHEGGKLTLQMRHKAPWYWFLKDGLLDSLDHTFIFSQQADGDIITIAFAVIPLLWTGWQIFKKRISRQRMLIAIAIGLGASTLQGIYALIRLDQVSIISKAVVFSPLSIMATFVLCTCGTLIYIQAHSRAGKVTALLVITFASWLPLVVMLALIAAINTFAFRPQIGTALYNYSLGLLPTSSFLLTFALSGLILRFISPKKE